MNMMSTLVAYLLNIGVVKSLYLLTSAPSTTLMLTSLVSASQRVLLVLLALPVSLVHVGPLVRKVQQALLVPKVHK